MPGFDPQHLEPAPDLVVIGNVCRPENPEAQRRDRRAACATTHIAGALAEHVLSGTSPLVVAGTHGKTTTSAMCRAGCSTRRGREPGFLIGGLPKNFAAQLPRRPEASAALAAARGASAGAAHAVRHRGRRVRHGVLREDAQVLALPARGRDRHLASSTTTSTSTPTRRRTSRRSQASSRACPRTGSSSRTPRDPRGRRDRDDSRARAEVAVVRARGRRDARASRRTGSPRRPSEDAERAERSICSPAASPAGRCALPLPGRHNLRNALAAIAAAAQGFGVPLADVRARRWRAFEGVRRRQELLGEPRGVSRLRRLRAPPDGRARDARARSARRHPRDGSGPCSSRAARPRAARCTRQEYARRVRAPPTWCSRAARPQQHPRGGAPRSRRAGRSDCSRARHRRAAASTSTPSSQRWRSDARDGRHRGAALERRVRRHPRQALERARRRPTRALGGGCVDFLLLPRAHSVCMVHASRRQSFCGLDDVRACSIRASAWNHAASMHITCACRRPV